MDITFDPETELEFKVTGSSSIFLTGSYVDDEQNELPPNTTLQAMAQVANPGSRRKRGGKMNEDLEKIENGQKKRKSEQGGEKVEKKKKRVSYSSEVDEKEKEREKQKEEQEELKSTMKELLKRRLKKLQKKKDVDETQSNQQKEAEKDEVHIEEEEQENEGNENEEVEEESGEENKEESNQENEEKMEKDDSRNPEKLFNPIASIFSKKGVSTEDMKSFWVGANELFYVDVAEGSGTKRVRKSSQVRIKYEGRFAKNGVVFDSTGKHNTYNFIVGRGEVIQGLDKGMKGMKMGARRILYIPAPLAYGEEGYPPDIPPDSDLIFDVTLVGFGSGRKKRRPRASKRRLD